MRTVQALEGERGREGEGEGGERERERERVMRDKGAKKERE